MARVDELQVPIEIEDPEKHCGIAANLRVVTQKPVHVIEYARRVSPQRHSRQGSLQHGRHNRRAQAFAGNICKQERCPAFADWKHIKIVASDCQAREVATGDAEMRDLAEISRQKRLLDVSRSEERRVGKECRSRWSP